MESLGDAYEGPALDVRAPRRVLAGSGLLAVAVATVAVAIVVATGTVNGLVGAPDLVAAQGLAATMAGLAVPGIFCGVVLVLPARRRHRVGVLAGTGLALAGVALFQVAYPTRWAGSGSGLAFLTALAYTAGGLVALWFVFRAVVAFRVHNAPAGTVDLELTREGETKTVTLSQDEYRRYARAVRSDGGSTQQIVQELESRGEE